MKTKVSWQFIPFFTDPTLIKGLKSVGNYNTHKTRTHICTGEFSYYGSKHGHEVRLGLYVPLTNMTLN